MERSAIAAFGSALLGINALTAAQVDGDTAATPPDGIAEPEDRSAAELTSAELSTAERTTTEPRFVLIEDVIAPVVTIAWETTSGETVLYEATRPFRADADRTLLGGNIEAYVGAGGVRLTKGAGHPLGAIARVGFYKAEAAKPFFSDIKPGSSVTVELKGVRYNQRVAVTDRSVVQHLKYSPEDLESCGLPGDAREQFNIASAVDTLNGRVRVGTDARLGVFSGCSESPGAVWFTEAEDGSVSMKATFEYAALRNVRDPWVSDLPGTFLEPVHFHIEFEALPEGVEPLDPSRPMREDYAGPETPIVIPNASR